MMRIIYHERDDILLIELGSGAVVRDESVNWNIHIGYTADGIGEITILDATKNGIDPSNIEWVASDADERHRAII